MDFDTVVRIPSVLVGFVWMEMQPLGLVCPDVGVAALLKEKNMQPACLYPRRCKQSLSKLSKMLFQEGSPALGTGHGHQRTWWICLISRFSILTIKLHSTFEMSQQMIEGCQLSKVLVNCQQPLPSSFLQEITAQYGIGIGNTIGNISLISNKLSWCSRFITVPTSWGP